MNFERYVAQKLRTSGGRFSKPIVIIGIAGVAISIAIILLSFAIVRGFTEGITEKTVGFNAHVQVTDFTAVRGKEARPIIKDQKQIDQLLALPNVKSVHPFVNKQSIIETDEGIAGIMVKGCGKDFNWAFFNNHLAEGKSLQWTDEPEKEVLISTTIANKLKIKVGDRPMFYFVKNEEDFAPRRMTVVGLYNTDMYEFDELIVLMDVRHLQNINDWGLSIQALVEPACDNGQARVEVKTFGAKDRESIIWSDQKSHNSKIRYFCPSETPSVYAVMQDDIGTVPDTVFVQFEAQANGNCGCDNYIASVSTSGGSSKDYVGGLEVYLEDFEKLDESRLAVAGVVGNEVNTSTIYDQNPEIFSWLELIDINVYILIILLLGVAIINMSSALIINILERTKLIGVLKSLGATNWSVRKVFLWHALRMIGFGLIIGNIIGLGVAWLQQKYSIMKLDPESYTLSEVPIIIYWQDVLLLDIGAVLICLVALIVPSYLITRITPVQAIGLD